MQPNNKEQQSKKTQIGSTWSDASIKIDLDNLMGKKDNKGNAPSMNQLKSATNSPVHAAAPQKPSMMSPLSPPGNFMGMGQTFAYNQSQPQQTFNKGAFIGSQESNNNNFNQFHAFQ